MKSRNPERGGANMALSDYNFKKYIKVKSSVLFPAIYKQTTPFVAVPDHLSTNPNIHLFLRKCHNILNR